MTAWMFLSLALAAGEPAAGQPGPAPATAAFEAARRDEIFGRALLALQRRGAVVAALDRPTGLIATRAAPVPDVPCGAATCRAREAIQIVLAPSGEASVRVVREARGNFSADVDAWYSLDREQAAEVAHQQAALLAEILGTPPPAGPPAPKAPPTRDVGQGCQGDEECKTGTCFRGRCMPRK